MWGSGFRVLGLGVPCLGLRIQGLESRSRAVAIQGSWVWGAVSSV